MTVINYHRYGSAFWGCSIHLYCTSLSDTGECGSVVSGQLNNIRTDVMSGSQSVIIKMLTGMNKCTFLFFLCVIICSMHCINALVHIL